MRLSPRDVVLAVCCCNSTGFLLLHPERAGRDRLGVALVQFGQLLLERSRVEAAAGGLQPGDLAGESVDGVNAGVVHVLLEEILDGGDLGVQLFLHAAELLQLLDVVVDLFSGAHSSVLLFLFG